jgi:benzoate transport
VPRSAASRWVSVLCWAIVLSEGFDLVVLGALLPSMIDDWGISPATGSMLATLGLVGVAIGSIGIGTLSDRIGRRAALLISVGSFSVLTVLCTFAPGPELLGVLRLLAGLGFGGCLPTAAAMVSEMAAPRGHSGSMTLMMTGYHTGAVLAAVLTIPVIAITDWQLMFMIGGAIGLVVFALCWFKLPESPSYLISVGRTEQAETLINTLRLPRPPAAVFEVDQSVKPGIGALFQRGYLRATIAFWVASFMGLLLVYGLNTWLPVLMREAGYRLNASLALLFILNIGGVIGLLLAGRVADRFGNKPINLLWFLGAAVFLAVLAIRLPSLALYLAVGFAGLFVFSAQVLVYAFVGRVFPPRARATAIGWSAGVGRLGGISGPIIGGALITAGIGYPWGFFVFSGVAVLAVLAVSIVPLIGGARSDTDR